MKAVFLFLLLAFCSKAQLDSTISVPLIGIQFGGQLPGGDMVKRFGANLEAGGMFAYKTNKNWIIGLESNFMFGRNVKEDVLKKLKNADGFVTDNEGYRADLRVTERGLGIHLFLGKVIRIKGLNPNSGLMISIGTGYMQHKINLYDAQQKIAAIKGSLKYGYDRLSNGISFSQFIGYLNLSENRMLNFYVGVQLYQGLTSSVRKLNYDTGLPDTKQRLDVLTGMRVGWILPLYKKKPNDFYIN
ncbi:MAG: hypothetical protein IT236_10020 [Bacteroidia bacterium]|nr:hypothetical protein [Bacteroidia bacterium]